MTRFEISSFLKSNFGYPALDFKWTSEYNERFFMFINEKTPEHYLKEKKNLLEIKEGFKKYFEPVGYILFKVKNYQIKFKIFPYTIDPKSSIHVNTIVNIISENEQFIDNEYNGKKEQKLIRKELRQKIFDFVETIDNDHINKKDLVKHAVREAFVLKENDIVIVKTDTIFIKICNIVKEFKVINPEKNLIERRYDGINEKELESFVQEHFSGKGSVEFFHNVARIFVDKYFLKNKIENQEYEKNAFAYIKKIVGKELIKQFDNCQDFFTGLAGYVFRQNFEEIFINIAELLLIEISVSNEHVMTFFRYYALDIIFIDGIRYKVPSLESENGLKWNVLSILSIVKLYVKAKLATNMLVKEIEIKEEKLVQSFKEGLSPVEYNHKCNEMNKKIKNKIEEYNHKLDRTYDSLKIAKNENRKYSLEREMEYIKTEIKNLTEESKQLSIKLINQIDLNKFITLEKEIVSLRRQLQREEKISQQNEPSFHLIKIALVKALISKKQRI